MTTTPTDPLRDELMKAAREYWPIRAIHSTMPDTLTDFALPYAREAAELRERVKQLEYILDNGLSNTQP